MGLPPFCRVFRRDTQVLCQDLGGTRGRRQPDYRTCAVFVLPGSAQGVHRSGLSSACGADQHVQDAAGNRDPDEGLRLVLAQHTPFGVWTAGDAFHCSQADRRPGRVVAVLQESVLSVEELVGGVEGGVLRAEDGGGVRAAERCRAGSQFERGQSQRHRLRGIHDHSDDGFAVLGGGEPVVHGLAGCFGGEVPASPR